MGKRLGKDSRTWILQVILIALGALLNRIRGGLWDVWNKKFWYPLFLGTVGCLYGLPWWMGLVLTSLWYLGQQIYGWGNYFGCAIWGKDKDENEDCWWINKLCSKWNGRKYGVATLWIRGAVWNTFPATGLLVWSLAGGHSCSALIESLIAFQTILPAFFGLIPACLGIAGGYNTKTGPWDKNAWNWSEVLWGGLQTGAWCWVLENIGGF